MRSKIALKNSSIGIMAQAITMLFSFITRRFFIQYLGLEVLGINGVISNILNMLQLTELGIGTAIIYALYEPIVENDQKNIAALMQLYRKFYNTIGAVIGILGIGISFFLDFFVTTELSMDYVRIIFFIQLAGTIVSYMLAYRRSLFYADQRQYVCTLVDMILNIVCSIIRIGIIILLHNYLLYLGVTLVQNLVSNIFVFYKCNKDYPFLNKYRHERYEKKEELTKNIKDLFIGKIGGFIYSSTDSILISKFLGVVWVGLLSNYSLLTTSCKTIINSMTNAIQPIMGNFVRVQEDKKEIKKIFYVNTFIRFLIVNVCVVGIIVLADECIYLWIGQDDICLGIFVPILLCVDLYIHNVHGPIVELLAVLGYFEFDKKITFMGVFINLVLSIVMLKFVGIEGVLIGTAVAQVYYWIVRGRKIFKDYFAANAGGYVVKNIIYIIFTVGEVIVLNWIKGKVFNEISILNFICMGIIVVMFCGIIDMFLMFFTQEGQYMSKMIENMLKKEENGE